MGHNVFVNGGQALTADAARRWRAWNWCHISPMSCIQAAFAQRVAQNGVQEKLTALWIDRCHKLLPPPAERKAA